MADDDRSRRGRDWLLDVPGIAELSVPDTSLVDDLAGQVDALVRGAQPDPERIESALSAVDVAGLRDREIDATVLSEGASVAPEEVDGVIEAGGEAVNVAVQTGEDAARVVLDGSGEAVEVVVDGGGEEAGEAVVEVLAAALEGL